MEIKDKIKELRESTGMNRKEFCEYFGIPYRTVTEWERGTRKMPDYVFLGDMVYLLHRANSLF